MAIEAVKIPQNVYVEDHIVGPVTLKQLFIVGIGGGISYVTYAIVTKAGYTDIPVQVMCWAPAFISACFAFMKINDLSLFNMILLTIESMNKPNVRYWSSHAGISINVITRQNMQQIETMQDKAHETTAKLAEMTRQLEKRQGEINRMASHTVDQKPDAVEAVKTQMMDIIGPDANTAPEETLNVNVRPNEAEQHGSSLPVKSSRIQALGLDPARSIDTVSQDLRAYETFTASRI